MTRNGSKDSAAEHRHGSASKGLGCDNRQPLIDGLVEGGSGSFPSRAT
jgi:hypothetical protein